MPAAAGHRPRPTHNGATHRPRLAPAGPRPGQARQNPRRSGPRRQPGPSQSRAGGRVPPQNGASVCPEGGTYHNGKRDCALPFRGAAQRAAGCELLSSVVELAGMGASCGWLWLWVALALSWSVGGAGVVHFPLMLSWFWLSSSSPLCGSGCVLPLVSPCLARSEDRTAGQSPSSTLSGQSPVPRPAPYPLPLPPFTHLSTLRLDQPDS